MGTYNIDGEGQGSTHMVAHTFVPRDALLWLWESLLSIFKTVSKFSDQQRSTMK